MPNNPLTPVELRLLAELLELASDTFANHGSNDFDLAKSVPLLEDRRQLMKSYNEHNGSPEDFEHDEKQSSQFELGHDASMMGYLAHRVREQIGDSPKSLADMKDANEAAWEHDLASAYERYNEVDYYGDE